MQTGQVRLEIVSYRQLYRVSILFLPRQVVRMQRNHYCGVVDWVNSILDGTFYGWMMTVTTP